MGKRSQERMLGKTKTEREANPNGYKYLSKQKKQKPRMMIPPMLMGAGNAKKKEATKQTE